MRTAPAVLAFFFMSYTAQAAEKPINLWPSGVPGERATTEQETNLTTPKENKPAGRPVIRLGNVTEPTLTFYPAPKETNTRAAVLVFPGGGYRILAYDLEGTEICEWLNSIGVNAVLVKYRVPQPKDVARHKQPLQDAQRAMGIVRSKAAEWGFDATKVGVLGFSAGGHLAALLSNSSSDRTYARVDEADTLSSHPAFVILIYPAYLSEGDKGEVLATEMKLADTPPTFIAQTEDDKNFIGGTLLYYRALRDAGVPAEIHIYSHGGHGYGMRSTKDPITLWPNLAGTWLKGILTTTSTHS